MSVNLEETANGVLVVCRDAAEYWPLLQPLASTGITLNFASNAEEALAAYAGQPVLLAQPDMAAALVDQLPAVRWVQSTWAGITPLLHTRRQDYVLTGIKNVFGPQMAEYVLGYILAHELRLAERLELQRKKSWWDHPSGRLQGKTLGVMGTGSIGSHIARAAHCLGLKIIGFNRGGTACDGFSKVFGEPGLDQFLQQADYVVAVLPDTPQTTGMMNAERFASMKPTAVFINVGRGNLVDEDALERALRQKQLAGAVLDVFRKEPLDPASSLWNTPGLVITGHTAARSWPRDIAGIFLDNFSRFQQHQELKFVIDRERGY